MRGACCLRHGRCRSSPGWSLQGGKVEVGGRGGVVSREGRRSVGGLEEVGSVRGDGMRAWRLEAVGIAGARQLCGARMRGGLLPASMKGCDATSASRYTLDPLIPHPNHHPLRHRRGCCRPGRQWKPGGGRPPGPGAGDAA
jgi:hypothetical protein